MKIGVLGGTGPAGRGIATRLVSVGHEVTLGSRDPERARTVVDELRERWGARVDGLVGGSNSDAAEATDMVVVATVWEAAVSTAAEHGAQLAGKVVVAMANGLVKEGRQFRPVIPPEGSLAQAVQAVAPEARVVAAFHLVPAAVLGNLDHVITGDVLVVGDDDEARTTVLDLIDAIPDLRGLDAGSLFNALGLEAFSAALLTVNLRHKGEGSLRIEGVGPRKAPPTAPIGA